MRIAVSQQGRLHRPGCKHAGVRHIWLWAADKSRAAVLHAAIDSGFEVCQHCQPFNLIRDQEEEPCPNGIS